MAAISTVDVVFTVTHIVKVHIKHRYDVVDIGNSFHFGYIISIIYFTVFNFFICFTNLLFFMYVTGWRIQSLDNKDNIEVYKYGREINLEL